MLSLKFEYSNTLFSYHYFSSLSSPLKSFNLSIFSPLELLNKTIKKRVKETSEEGKGLRFSIIFLKPSHHTFCLFFYVFHFMYPIFRQFFLKMHFMCRYVASELASDIVVSVGDIKFYLHKVWFSPVNLSSLQLGISILAFSDSTSLKSQYLWQFLDSYCQKFILWYSFPNIFMYGEDDLLFDVIFP